MKNAKLIFTLFVFALSAQLFALPRFATKLGDKCSDCHVNPTGGGMLSEDGWYFAKNVLGARSSREFDSPPKLNKSIQFGLDFRSQFLYSEELKRSDFQNMSASLYSSIQISEEIVVSARYDYLQRIWEGYGIVNFFNKSGYVKAGAFTPNFGIRIDDHTAYTRGGDNFVTATVGVSRGNLYSPSYTETGVELGYSLDKLLFVTFSAAKSNFNRTLASDPTYTSRVEVRPTIGDANLVIGASGAMVKLPASAKIYGFFGGIGFGEFSLLAEYDKAENYLTADAQSVLAMTEVAYRFMLGGEAVVRYDYIDPNASIDKDQISRLVVGFEFMPYSFVEIRPQYRFQLEDATLPNNSLVVQLHLFY